MSLGGFTNFAKNALISAQKHIDSALHIEEGEEDEEGAEGAGADIGNVKGDSRAQAQREQEEGTGYGWDEATSSVYENILINSSSSASQSQQREREASGCSSTSTRSDHKKRAETDGFLDVDLSANSPPQSHWGGDDANNRMQTIVDTEPNPIRDAHEHENILHYSPSSHSPDDDETSQNGQSSSTAQAASSSTLDLSLIILDSREKHLLENEPRRMARELSEKTLDRFEEVGTIASSDIEVIRQMDTWSIASSQSHNLQTRARPSIGLKEMLKDSSAPELITSKSNEAPSSLSQQEMTEQISVLSGKLRHRDQRIEELGKLNENLKAANANLTAKNKQRSASEAKLQGQLSEKEKQLNDLLEEGRKLSEYSGRQANEIRKLKQQLGQMETVEAARDSAVEEFQEVHQQMQEQEKTIAQKKADLEKADKRAEQLKTELDKVSAHLHELEKKVCEQLGQLENGGAELKRLERELRESNRQREDLIKENRQLSAKLMSKKAQERMEDEREQGRAEDLKLERAKGAAAAARIRELEERLESMQNQQRDVAIEIANANSPLLDKIALLEEKLFSLERQNDSTFRSLRKANEEIAEQRQKHQFEVESTLRSLEEERQNGAQKTEELTKAFAERANLQSQLKEVEAEFASSRKRHSERMDRLEQQVEQLEAEVATKRTDLAELQRKNRELQQRVAVAERKAHHSNVPVDNGPLAFVQPMVAQEMPKNEISGGRAEFQQQMEALRRTLVKREIPLQKVASSASSTTSEQNKVKDALIREQGMDYTMDFIPSEHLRSELDAAHGQLFQLHERFDHLLELYGGCLENIEEMREDNEDLRKLCREQALRLTGLEQKKEEEGGEDND